MYFESMKKTNYSFPSFPETEMQDIFSRVAFTEETKNENKNFKSYLVKEGYTPEKVAFDFYGDEKYWWLVLLSNNMIDPINDWVMSDREIESHLSNFLSGSSYYIYENLNVKPGDIIIKRDTSMTGDIDTDVYGIIDDYDSFLHKINVRFENSSFTQGDDFFIFRENDNGSEWNLITGFGKTGCYPPYCGSTACLPEGPNCPTAGIDYATIRKKDEIKNSLHHFQYVANQDHVDPYSNDYVTGLSCSAFGFQNICGLTSTVLYKYISDDGFLSADQIESIKTLTQFINDNDKKRSIKLIASRLAPMIELEIKSLFRRNTHRGTLRYIEVK